MTLLIQPPDLRRETAVPPPEPGGGFARGIDAALSLIDTRIHHWLRRREGTGNPAGVIENELRWLKGQIQARGRGEQ